MPLPPPDAGDVGAAPNPDESFEPQTDPETETDSEIEPEPDSEAEQEFPPQESRPIAEEAEDSVSFAPAETAYDDEDTPMAPPSFDDEAIGGYEQAASDEADAGRGEAPARRSVIVRYGLMKHVGQFRHNLDQPPRAGSHVVIRTERGVELGEVLADVCERTCFGCLQTKQLADFVKANGPEYPFRRDGKVLREANPQDVIDQRHLDSSSAEEGAYCRQQIRDLHLDMRLVTVEHLLGGERIIFYFSAETRVDFRELVRRLASQYRTRIEMRQVGARDEARLVADYERCGQRCCCQQYIKDLKPVSMRMAKTQKATLDPSKISGRCGRLMCCLRYEDAAYEDLRRSLPKKNIWVRTADLVGRVVDTQILTQLVRLELPDRTYVAVPNEEILERNVEPPPAQERPEPRRSGLPRPRPTALLRDTVVEQTPPVAEAVAAAEAIEAPADEPAAEGAAPQAAPGQGKRRRGRRRSGRRSGGDGGQRNDSQRQPQGQQRPPAQRDASGGEDGGADIDAGDSGGEGAAPTGAPGQQGQLGEGGQRKRRRHRRRRRGGNRPPGGEGGDGGPQGSEGGHGDGEAPGE